MVLTKVCSTCNKTLPATTDYFTKRKDSKDGLKGKCKDCIKEYNIKYQAGNREKILEQKKQYHIKNREQRLEYNKQHYWENRDRITIRMQEYNNKTKEERSKYNKQHYKENKEDIAKYGKEYYKNNKEQILKDKREYYIKNSEIIKNNIHKRATMKKKLPYTLTVKQWRQIKSDFEGSCAYCGMTEEEHFEKYNEQLHQEHFIALTKGGGFTHNNIIPSCKGCNNKKYNYDFFEWYPQQEFYCKKREKKILEYLNYKDEGIQQLSIL